MHVDSTGRTLKVFFTLRPIFQSFRLQNITKYIFCETTYTFFRKMTPVSGTTVDLNGLSRMKSFSDTVIFSYLVTF